MGQVTALLYKNYKVLVKRKIICMFQVGSFNKFLMPVLSIIVVLITKQVYEAVYESEMTSQVFPRYLFKSGIPSDIKLLRDKTSSIEVENCHQVENCYRDIRLFLQKWNIEGNPIFVQRAIKPSSQIILF
jgi:hypothetical protein